jgi:acyl-coenzyme A synthetase/AMP-(fatty) acid ligase
MAGLNVVDPPGQEAQGQQHAGQADAAANPQRDVHAVHERGAHQLEQRFVDSYLSRYPGACITGDGGYRDSDGYLYVMGRTDDIINVAGRGSL